MSKFYTYRLFMQKPIGVTNAGNISSAQNSSLLLSEKFSPTTIIFRARSGQEAMKKADKFWRNGDFGQGCITVVKEV